MQHPSSVGHMIRSRSLHELGWGTRRTTTNSWLSRRLVVKGEALVLAAAAGIGVDAHLGLEVAAATAPATAPAPAAAVAPAASAPSAEAATCTIGPRSGSCLKAHAWCVNSLR